MDNLTLSTPQNVVEALKQGKKIAVFAINDEKKPIEKISDINTPFFAIVDREESLIEPALRYLRNNFNKDIKLEFLSDLCQLSPNYFCSLFAKVRGVGVTVYVRTLRLKQACMLLKNTNQSIVSIAAEVGYLDSGYFNKVFKNEFGCTPMQYRNIVRGKSNK